ncbi:hypothetical protein RA263_27920, partial [Pseudomonas syringae pv. tagetis]|uniref:hypothetical protein n=1 Tax=Pseudomonas syringae group genomosp. 7 TaxID=251699 RepID=UPI00376FEC7B
VFCLFVWLVVVVFGFGGLVFVVVSGMVVVLLVVFLLSGFCGLFLWFCGGFGWSFALCLWFLASFAGWCGGGGCVLVWGVFWVLVGGVDLGGVGWS